jgi:DNA-binding transcriptional ArsR family regulator
MPSREIATQELASLFGALSHPQRVRIVEELRQGELDVNQLADLLRCSHSRVSQHLALLKAHRLVEPRREGRHVHYSLVAPEVARWVLEGLDFTEAALLEPGRVQRAMASAREAWGDDGSEG